MTAPVPVGAAPWQNRWLVNRKGRWRGWEIEIGVEIG